MDSAPSEWRHRDACTAWLRERFEAASAGAVSQYEKCAKRINKGRTPEASALFEFDLYRGCWAAASYQEAGGTSAELARRKELRTQSLKSLVDIMGATTTLSVFAREASAIPDDDTHTVTTGGAWPLPIGNHLAQLWPPAQWRQLSAKLAELSSFLETIHHQDAVKSPGVGCVTFPAPLVAPGGQCETDSESSGLDPVEILRGEAAAWGSVKDAGRPPTLDSMIAFDLVFRVSAWSAGAVCEGLSLTAFPGRTARGYAYVAALMNICFPSASPRDVFWVKETVKASGNWQWFPWPAETDLLQDFKAPLHSLDYSNLLKGLALFLSKKGG